MRKAQGYLPPTPSNPLLASSQCRAWFLVALSLSSGGAVNGADLSCAHMTCASGLEAFSPSLSLVYPRRGQRRHTTGRPGILSPELALLPSGPCLLTLRLPPSGQTGHSTGPLMSRNLFAPSGLMRGALKRLIPSHSYATPSSVLAQMGFSLEGTRLCPPSRPRASGSDPCPLGPGTEAPRPGHPVHQAEARAGPGFCGSTRPAGRFVLCAQGGSVAGT